MTGRMNTTVQLSLDRDRTTVRIGGTVCYDETGVALYTRESLHLMCVGDRAREFIDRGGSTDQLFFCAPYEHGVPHAPSQMSSPYLKRVVGTALDRFSSAGNRRPILFQVIVSVDPGCSRDDLPAMRTALHETGVLTVRFTTLDFEQIAERETPEGYINLGDDEVQVARAPRKALVAIFLMLIPLIVCMPELVTGIWKAPALAWLLAVEVMTATAGWMKIASLSDACCTCPGHETESHRACRTLVLSVIMLVTPVVFLRCIAGDSLVTMLMLAAPLFLLSMNRRVIRQLRAVLNHLIYIQHYEQN